MTTSMENSSSSSSLQPLHDERKRSTNHTGTLQSPVFEHKFSAIVNMRGLSNAKAAAALTNLLAASIVASINTPTAIQSSGFLPNCAGFAFATASPDSCSAIAQRNGLDLDDFLRLNPQMGGFAGCASSLVHDFAYCVHTMDAATHTFYKDTQPTPHSLPAPAGPAMAGISFGPLPQETTPQIVVTVTATHTTMSTMTFSALYSVITPPPTVPSCTVDGCYKGFLWGNKGTYGVAQTSWCNWVLDNKVPDTDWVQFTGVPLLVSSYCVPEQMTASCECLTAGRITNLPYTGYVP
jgi:hypothetical protein